MKNPLISVIVPVYKTEKYLDACINSIVNQTYKNLEIILVDDGSHDSCPEICDRWAAKDARIKVIHKENAGASKARHTGIAAAAGDYIGFIDSDDLIEGDLYQACADAIDATSAQIVMYDLCFDINDARVDNIQNAKPGFYDREKLTKSFMPQMIYNFNVLPSVCLKLFKKEVLNNCKNEITADMQIGEDAAFSFPYIASAQSLYYIQKIFYHYRIIDESSTHKYNPRLHLNYLNSYYHLLQFFSKTDFDMQKSLDFYLCYLVTMMVRNEMRPGGNVKNALSVIENEDITQAVGRASLSYFKTDEKLLLKAVAHKSKVLVELYMVLFKNYNNEKGLIFNIKKIIVKITDFFKGSVRKLSR